MLNGYAKLRLLGTHHSIVKVLSQYMDELNKGIDIV